MLQHAVRHRRILLVLSVAGLSVCALTAVPSVFRACAGDAWGAAARGRTVPARPEGPRGPLSLASTVRQDASFTIIARKYEFSPARITVRQDDLVKITLVAEDIPHSFTLDALKIAKRASPGHPAVFVFRAELPDGTGDVTFPFYCNLSIDEGCRRMRGELVIERKR